VTINGVDASRFGSADDEVIVWIDRSARPVLEAGWSEQYPEGDSHFSVSPND
jgi:hypothetical protein